MFQRQIAIAVAIVGCSFIAACNSSEPQAPVPPVKPVESPIVPQATPVQAAPQTAKADDPRFLADDLPLLPIGVDRGVAPLPVIRAAYEFAARHPEVMHYVPCFCGCERGGHKDNHDCFVSGRDAKSHVTSWEP